MSFSINLNVDESGDVTVQHVTTGDAAPPAGHYSITGHQHNGEPASAGPYISVASPVGGCTASFPAPKSAAVASECSDR